MSRGRCCIVGHWSGRLVASVLLFFLFSSVSEARTWFKGTVTSTASVNIGKIEIDGVRFTFMPRASVKQRYEIAFGEFQFRNISLNRVQAGSRVRMLIEGHRIYQLVLNR